MVDDTDSGPCQSEERVVDSARDAVAAEAVAQAVTEARMAPSPADLGPSIAAS